MSAVTRKDCPLDTSASYLVSSCPIVSPVEYLNCLFFPFITVPCHPHLLLRLPVVREACSDLQPQAGRCFVVGCRHHSERCDGSVLARWYYIWSIALCDAQLLPLPVIGLASWWWGNVCRQQALVEWRWRWVMQALSRPNQGIPGCSQSPLLEKGKKNNHLKKYINRHSIVNVQKRGI